MKPENISDAAIKTLVTALRGWGEANFADFPWRTTTNRWHALSAEIMLQRTRAEQVVPAFEDFVKKYPTPADLAADPDSKVFATLGLHWREALIRDLAKELAGKDVPESRKDLLKLPGIGDYIASAFRSLHGGGTDRIIDANVVRLYGRYFGFETHGETRRKRWFITLAERITPAKDTKGFNYALLDFTREICRPAPVCERCPLTQDCAYYKSIANQDNTTQ